MAYLVTGGTGYLGSYVVRDLLAEGKDVVCLQRSGITPVFREIVGEDNVSKPEIVQADVSNTLRLFNVIREHNVDVVVHLGCLIASRGESEEQPAYALQVNCVGTNNVLEAARLFGLRRVVWTSSGQSFGPVSQYYREAVGDDDALYMPDTMYGATKVLNEYMSRHYARRFGVDSICLRMGFTLGIGKLHGRGGSFSKFLQDAATSVPVTMAMVDVEKIRSFSYVENISALIVAACEAPTPRTKTFSAVEFQISARQLVEALCRVNPEAKITLKDGVTPEEATLGSTPEPLLDTTGIRTQLGWKPKYDLDESMRRIFNYYRRQEGLPLL